MAQAISFPTIPSNLKVPLFQLEFATSPQPGAQEQNSLLIGNTVTAQPAVPVPVSSIAQAVSLFGAGSILAHMAEAYLSADPSAELYCLPVADNGSGTKASGSIAITGTTTAAGTVALYIGGRSIPVAVTSGMSASAVATAIQTAIAAYVDANGCAAPVAAAIDGTHNYQVDLTANNAGTPGNSIDIRLNYYGLANNEQTPAGISVAVTAMSGGATDPTTSGIAAILGSVNYDFIAIPWTSATALNDMQTMMSNAAGRWSYQNQIYGHVFAAKMDADNTGATNLTFGQGRNDPHMTIVSYEPAPPTPWFLAAAFMGAFAASSRADPARPTQTLLVPNVKAPPKSGQYSFAVQNNLLNAGLALLRYNPDGTCAILRSVTTYQKNQWGATDTSYLDAETLFTLMAVVRTLKNDILSTFPRAKLVSDGVSFGPGTSFSNGLPDQPVTSPNGIKAALIASYAAMEAQGLVQDPADFALGLIVQQNATDPTRVDVLYDPILVSGLRVLAALTQFALQAPQS